MNAWLAEVLHRCWPFGGGILVQLPLPKHMNEEKVLAAISLEKDVDGFHPLNIGKLSMKGHEPLFMPCTPKVGSPPSPPRARRRVYYVSHQPPLFCFRDVNTRRMKLVIIPGDVTSVRRGVHRVVGAKRRGAKG